MRRLTTKQRFALTFSVYVFCLLVILYSIFFVIFNVTVSNQVNKQLTLAATDIITNHLFLEKGQLVFKVDTAGASLKEYLIAHNTSAVFMDMQKNVVRTYGLFALNETKEDIASYHSLTEKTAPSVVYTTTNITLNEQQVATVVIPLQNNNTRLGYMILGRSLAEFSVIKQVIMLLFLSLGGATVMGSFIIGYLLARFAFSPLEKMIYVIERVELDNLGDSLAISGHPNDELVRLARKFNEMTLRLKDMAERQKSFIANASHELKTPLTRAISSLELLSHQAIPDKKETALIRDDLFHINTLLEKLLLLTQLKKDIQLVTPYPVDVRTLFVTLKKRFEKEFTQKGLHLVVHMPEELLLSIPVEYVTIIFSNLFSNAIKYSYSGGTIFVHAFTEGKQVRFTIKDEGLGMTQDEVSRMFDRFYRGNKGDAEGFGIGLSIVKQICDIYAISIHVDSEKGKGTKISLHFS